MNAMTPIDPNDIDLSEGDINDASAAIRSAHKTILNDGLEHNPDDVAQAQDISDLTGARPEHVIDNLDEYKADLRQRAAHELVLNNPDLITYIQSHPLAAGVSNDDWGNLDKFTREAQGGFWRSLLPRESTVDAIAGALKGGLEGASEGLGHEPVGDWARGWASEYYDPKTQRLGWSAAAALGTPAEVVIRGIMAGLGGVTGAGVGGLEGLGFDPMESRRIFEATTNMQMAEVGLHELPKGPKSTTPNLSDTAQETHMQRQTALDKMRTWVQAGVEIPAGVHPDIDAIKSEVNANLLKAIDTDLTNAGASATRERAPELFQRLTGRMYGDHQIGIGADAALALYGDKPPAIDDGLLGWVPNIESQLAAARDTGDDISVPLKDWIAKVDPEVAKGLHDHIRAWTGGITEAESKLIPTEPKATIDETLPAVRAAAGLEPKFSIGDRKLTLLKGEVEPGDQFHPEAHNWSFLDENGKDVGQLSILPGTDGKTLYVDWIGGQAGLWANSFGPALIRDIKRQLKSAYPDYEYLTGHRVSGAREGVNNFGPMPLPRVRLESDAAGEAKDYATLKQEFAQAFYFKGLRTTAVDEGHDITTQHLTGDGFSALNAKAKFDELSNTIKTEMDRITGGGIKTDTNVGIKFRSQPKAMVTGSYIPSVEKEPRILLDLLGSADPMGTGRHEAIHYLRGYNFLTEGEWNKLTSAAESEGWLDRYGIHKRYAHLDDESKLEEAVADGFQEWAGQAPEVRPKTGIGAIFQKIMDLFDSVKKKLGFGPEETWENVFQKIHSGEVGQRGPGEPREGAFDLRAKMSANDDRFAGKAGLENDLRIINDSIAWREQLLRGEIKPGDYSSETAKYHAAQTKQNAPKEIAQLKAQAAKLQEKINNYKESDIPQARFSIDDQQKAIVEGITNLQAASVGMTVPRFRQLQDAIRKRAEEDLAKAKTLAEKEQAKRQTAEWKSNASAMAKEVAKDIRQRPDVAADEFLGHGVLHGEKTPQGRYTLDAASLSPEQKAMLPDHYVSASGLSPDMVGQLFGYSSGDELVARLGALEAMRKLPDGGRMRHSDMVRGLVKGETNRRMEAQYGNLQGNILDLAHDQALSESSINVMHEELLAAAEAGGVTAFDKSTMQKAASKLVAETTLGKLSSFRLMQTVNMHSRNAEASLLAGNFGEAAVHMQRQTLTAMVAAEAKRVEKEVATFDKVAKRMAKREAPSLPAEYTNWVHSILDQIGKPVKRGEADLTREIGEAGSGETLQAFVEEKNRWLQPVAVWDQLYEPGWKKAYKDLAAGEFRNVRDSVKSLMTVGRDELKVYKTGEAEDLAEVKGRMIEALEKFEARPEPGGGEGYIGGNIVSEKLRTYLADTLQIENLFGRWDHWDPKGVWTQYVLRDLIDGVNQSDAWKKEFAKKLSALKDDADLGKALENHLFKAPAEYGGHELAMNRANLRAVMLNMGNESNLKKLTKGWGINADVLRGWVMSKADAKDWKFVQGVWDIFSEMKGRSDTMYRSLAGVPAESIEPVPIETPHGTFPGGYYPVIYHENFAKIPKLMEVGLQQDGFEGATTPAGYTNTRTGFQAPLTMSLDRMPNRLSQIIHDTALRPAVLNAARVFRDPKIQAAITTHYGREYSKMMIPWLRNIANAANHVQTDGYVLDFLRQNLVSALVGFNPGTVLKHAPTALGLSVKEVGARKFFEQFFSAVPEHFFDSIRSLFGQSEASADSNWNFAKKNSLELQRRDRHWNETLYGATGELVPRSNAGVWRQKVMEWGSKPVALSDMISAVPTWLAKYREQTAAGAPHGDAVFEADRAVRRAHGSTAATNRPMITNKVSPWLTSVYNFFNDIMNRQMETVWKSGEMLGLAKQGDWAQARKYVGPVVTGAVAYAMWPAIVEAWVSPQEESPEDSWAKKAGKSMAFTLGASWVGVRDIANGLLEGKNPDVGLISTELKQLTDLARDWGKKAPFSPAQAQKTIRDAGNLVGILTGIPEQFARELSFAQGLSSGMEHPQGPWGWMVGARYGTTKGHSQTLDQYMQGQFRRK